MTAIRETVRRYTGQGPEESRDYERDGVLSGVICCPARFMLEDILPRIQVQHDMLSLISSSKRPNEQGSKATRPY